MSERWVKCTKIIVHSQGQAPDEEQAMYLNMERNLEILPDVHGDPPVPCTMIKSNVDSVLMKEEMTFFLPFDHVDCTHPDKP